MVLQTKRRPVVITGLKLFQFLLELERENYVNDLCAVARLLEI